MSGIQPLGLYNQKLYSSDETNDTSSFSPLPEEIILKIFSYLSPTELAKSGEVSRKWRRLTSDANLWNALDLRKIFLLLKVFDESDWVTHVDLPKYGLSVEDVPPLDKRTVIPLLKKHLSSWSVESNAGFTLLTIPKGLSFKKIIDVGMTKEAKFFIFTEKDLEETPINETYRIVITNSILKESEGLTLVDGDDLLKQNDCELPMLVEVTALQLTTFISSGKLLYRKFTRCLGRTSTNDLVTVGCTPEGFGIGETPSDGGFTFGSVLRINP